MPLTHLKSASISNLDDWTDELGNPQSNTILFNVPHENVDLHFEIRNLSLSILMLNEHASPTVPEGSRTSLKKTR